MKNKFVPFIKKTDYLINFQPKEKRELESNLIEQLKKEISFRETSIELWMLRENTGYFKGLIEKQIGERISFFAHDPVLETEMCVVTYLIHARKIIGNQRLERLSEFELELTEAANKLLK